MHPDGWESRQGDSPFFLLFVVCWWLVVVCWWLIVVCCLLVVGCSALLCAPAPLHLCTPAPLHPCSILSFPGSPWECPSGGSASCHCCYLTRGRASLIGVPRETLGTRDNQGRKTLVDSRLRGNDRFFCTS